MRAAQASLTIDLDAIAANWRLLGTLHPSGPVAGVVKADGYGVGALPVATRLYREGCRHFFVAHPGEAMAIRPAVPEAMVAVLNGLTDGAEREYVAHGLTPVLGSLHELALWRRAGAAAGQPLPALLHVDTGMSRLGLDPDELARLHADPSLLDGVAIRYVMTHLASPECPDDPQNAAQRARFLAACAVLPRLPRSLAASSGIFLGAEFGSDLARAGAALYGINPTPDRRNPMRPVVRLRARVLQLRTIQAGETVGYNATWTAPRPTVIATAGIGYADGWLRSLSNRAVALFDGTPVPLVGRVSMDLSTFDVTGCPAIQRGDWLDLIGPGQSVDDVAHAAGTNGYEVLTSLKQRFERTYLPS